MPSEPKEMSAVSKEAVKRPVPQGGDYRPHYRKREIDAYMDHLERENASLRAALAAHAGQILPTKKK